jgi:hypothetical protein
MREIILKVLPPAIGVIITLALASRIRGRLDAWVAKPAVDARYLFSPASPRPLGIMEALLSFIAVWLAQPVAIGGWLAFKVAAKWATWQHITKMTDVFGPGDPLEKVKTRDIIGSFILSRFLIGTLYNILCGVVGAAVSWFVQQLVKAGGAV